MAERIYGLLEAMEKFVDGGVHLGFMNKILLDENRLLEFVDALKDSLPAEIQQAKTLLNARNEILGKAKEDALKTRESLQKSLQDPQVHSADRDRANRLLQDAHREALYIRQEADAYVEQSLMKVHRLLANLDREILNGLQVLGREESRAGQVG